MKICGICKIMDKVNRILREIEKSLAGFEKTLREALKQLRGENGSNK